MKQKKGTAIAIPLTLLFKNSLKNKTKLIALIRIEKTASKAELIQTWNDIQNMNIIKTLFGVLINLGLIIYSIIMGVTFCAVWKQWAGGLVFLWVLAIVVDFILFEVILELALALMMWLKKVSFIFE